MRLHRFYIGGGKGRKAGVLAGVLNDSGARKLSDLAVSARLTLDSGANDNSASIIHQWRDVFRYTAGSRVVLFDDSKTECLCMIESLSMTKAELVIIEKNGSKKAKESMKKGNEKSKKGQGQGEAAPMGKVISMEALSGTFSSSFGESEDGKAPKEVWVLASIVKHDNFDLIIQKTTELGVDHIVPIISDRTIKKDINMKRSERIAVEASEQSGRLSVPVVHEPVAIKKAIELLMEMGGDVIVCSQHGKDWGEMRRFFKKYPVGFVIGPEGGWSEREEAYFKTSGLKMLKIGENVLRAETAAIAIVALMKI